MYSQRRKNKPAPTVTFTGFAEPDLARLSRLVLEAGYRSSPSVRAYTRVLCVGASPDPVEREAAEIFRVAALSEEAFLALLAGSGNSARVADV